MPQTSVKSCKTFRSNFQRKKNFINKCKCRRKRVTTYWKKSKNVYLGDRKSQTSVKKDIKMLI